jgi:hypothetical protein
MVEPQDDGINMRKRSGTISVEASPMPKNRVMLPHIKSWRPSRMKTALRNHLVGEEFSFAFLPAPKRARQTSISSEHPASILDFSRNIRSLVESADF